MEPRQWRRANDYLIDTLLEQWSGDIEGLLRTCLMVPSYIEAVDKECPMLPLNALWRTVIVEIRILLGVSVF